jgi:flagellar hook-associated protein 3 FlgL
MTRVTLLQMFNQGLNGILNVQSQQLKTQNQIASGTRILQPADDPVGAAQILRTNDELARIAQYQKNLDGAENSLMQEEAQLESITTLLIRVRELATSAGNPALSSTERKAIATEAGTRLEELVALANSRNTAGEYIFGGFQGEHAPFVQSGGSYQYRGDDGVRMAQVSGSTYVAMGHSGNQLFETIPMATVPAAAGTLVARAAAGVANTGSGVVGNGTVTDPVLFGATFPAGARYQLEITGYTTPPDQYDYNVLDSGGAVIGTAAAAASPIVFGGAEFTITGAPAAGDRFTLQAPSASIAAGHIVDRNAFESAFSGPASTYRINITGFTAPDQYSYEVLDSGNASVATGSYTDGERLTFGGVEFRIVDGAVGDSFTLSPPSSQNMLNTVERLATGLATLGDSPEDKLRLQELIAETLANLENAEDNVGVVRAQVGGRLNTIDSTRDMHGGTELVSNKVLSEVRDLDYAEALTRMTRENFILQAAQQSFAKISGLSLFNFLR